MKQLIFALTIVFASCNDKPAVVYNNPQWESWYAIKPDSNMIWRNKKTYYIVTATRDSVDSLNKPCYYVEMQYAKDKSYNLLTYYDNPDIVKGDTILEGATEGEFISLRPSFK